MFCIYGGTKFMKWGPFTDSICPSNSQGSDPGISHSKSIQSDRKHVATELKLKLYKVLETSIKTLHLITSRKSIIQMEHYDLYTHDQTTIFCISCDFWLQSQVHGEPYKDSQSSFKKQMIKCSKVFWNFSVKQEYRTGNANQETQPAYSWHCGPRIWAICSGTSYCVIFNVKSLAFK